MGTIVESFAKTLELLVVLVASGAEAAYQKVRPRARLYLKSLLVTALVGLALVPTLALVKMVTGAVVFAYAAALLAIVFTLVLGLLWSPLGVVMGMLAENTLNPVIAGERFVRFIATILFVELMISGYLVRVPTHQNLAAVPLLIMAAAAVGLGTFIWGGWLSGRFYVAIATVMVFLTTLSFFMPTVFEAVIQKLQATDTEIAKALGYQDPNVVYYNNGEVMLDLTEKIPILVEAYVWTKEEYLPAGRYLFYTPGEWLEYKGRDGINGRNFLYRQDSMHRETILSILGAGGKIYGKPVIFPMPMAIWSNGEYYRFRTDVTGLICILPMRKKR